MIRRWRGLPGSIVLLSFHALILMIASGLAMGLLLSGFREEYKNSLLTEHGEIVYHSWREQSRFYDATDRLLSDSESARVRLGMLSLGSYRMKQLGNRYWEPDADKPGLRWRNAAERWNALNPNNHSTSRRAPQWFFLPDENLLALYGEDGALAGRLGPDGFQRGAEPTRSFVGRVRPPDWNARESRRFLISDSVAFYAISTEPPEVIVNVPIPSGVEDYFDFSHSFWQEGMRGMGGGRFGWRVDSTIIIHAVEEGLRIDSIALPPRLMRVIEGDSSFQVHFGAPSEDGHISETAAFTISDDSGPLILFSNRFTGEILIETRPVSVSTRANHYAARETATFVAMTGLFSLQPMPLPIVGAFLTWHIYFNDEPATREERIASFLRPFRTEPQARRVAFWGCLWLLVVHFIGGVIGRRATRRAGAAPNVVTFWTLVGLVVGAPILWLLIFRGPRREPPSAPRPDRTGILAD
jgi:hypothetical protein